MQASLTFQEFKDAVDKGLGRAVLSITPPVSAEVAELILTSFHESSFDGQFEDSRSEFRYFLAEKAGLLEDLLLRLTNLPVDENEDANRERVELLGSFVRRQNQTALLELQSIALRGLVHAAEELVKSGELAWVVDNILPALPSEEKWRTRTWAEENPELDEVRRNLLLSADEEYASAHLQEQKPEIPAKEFDIYFDEILASTSHRIDMSRVLKEMTQDHFDKAVDIWLDSPDENHSGRIARILSKSKLHLDVGRVIEKVKNGSNPFNFEGILGKIDSKEIADFGIELLRADPPDPRGIDCLRSSFFIEDLDTIAESLPYFRDYDNDERHGICLSLIAIGESDEGKRNLPIMRWVYENSPCSFCRSSAVRMMVEADILPEEYVEELQFDAESDNRAVAFERLGKQDK